MLQRLLIITAAVLFTSTSAFAFQDSILDYPFDFSKTEEIAAIQKNFINNQEPQVLGAETEFQAQACEEALILDQNMKQGAQDGSFHAYEGSLVYQVALLQGHLNRLGLGPIAVDGSFGPATVKAVRELQSFFKLSADGIVGESTREVINNSCRS